MNLNKLVVSLVVCVAATVSLSACSSAIAIPLPSEKPTAESSPESIEPTEAEDYDEMVLWVEGRDAELAESVQPELDYFSEELGFDVSFELPGPAYTDQGWIGVAALRERCIVVVGYDEQSMDDGSLSVAIMSRYDQSLTVAAPWSTDYVGIREALDPYVTWCDGGPLPEISELPDDTSTSA